MSFICHIHNYTEYNEEWNVFSAFNPSKWSSGQPTLRRLGSSWGFGALLRGLTSVVDTSCQSRDSNPQPLQLTAASVWSPSSTRVEWSWKERGGRDPVFFSLSYAEIHWDKWRIHMPDSIADASYRLPRPSQSAGSVRFTFHLYL